ncbi:helix-turn-helix transcriptional regulator [Astrobacterium formosum]|uniref:helix-turn-helix transcriptional regulator n=1 Tax=Astrobacterium formosum TaxID=3069710 RepID=UPI003F501E1A
MAHRLAKVPGTSAQHWLNLQNDYDVQIAKRALGEILEHIETIKSPVEAKRRGQDEERDVRRLHEPEMKRSPSLILHCRGANAEFVADNEETPYRRSDARDSAARERRTNAHPSPS